MIFLPLRDLVSEHAISIGTLKRGDVEFDAPGFHIGGHFVWGATAMVLGQLRDLIRQVLSEQFPNQ